MISYRLLISRMIDKIRELVWLDSLVWLDYDTLSQALAADYKKFGHYLNDAECYIFVCGNDDGEIPGDLIARFPNTHKYLEDELS